jgi:hypothetical protein
MGICQKVCALALLLSLCAGVAFAATGNITYDKGQPSSPAAGQIKGSGSWDCDVGYSAASVNLVAYPKAGGTPLSASNRYAGQTGNWGPLTITGATSKAVYTVYAELTEKNGNGGTKELASAGVDVTVQ